MAKKATPATNGLDALMNVSTTVTKTSAKADDKEIYKVDDTNVAKAIDEFEAAKKEKKAAEGKMADAEAIIKPWCKGKMIENLEAGKKVESFIAANENQGIMYIVMDSYKKIADADRAQHLIDNYGADTVEKITEFAINPEMVQKHGALLAEAIKSMKISDEDKAKFLNVTITYKVKKGLVNRMKEVAKSAKTTIAAIWEEFIPTQQLKSRGEK